MASTASEPLEQPSAQSEIPQQADTEQKTVAGTDEHDEDIEDLFQESGDEEIVPELISADGNDFTKAYNRQRTSQSQTHRNPPRTQAQQSTTK
jgi:RIO kinase 1